MPNTDYWYGVLAVVFAVCVQLRLFGSDTDDVRPHNSLRLLFDVGLVCRGALNTSDELLASVRVGFLGTPILGNACFRLSFMLSLLPC